MEMWRKLIDFYLKFLLFFSNFKFYTIFVADYMAKIEVLEDKNTKLRQEIINMARERNEAESNAKDKIFLSNVKSQKIKVLKDQLNKKGKKKKNPDALIGKFYIRNQFIFSQDFFIHIF